MSSPAGTESRLYSSNGDLELMMGLLVRVRPSARVNEYPGKADIEEASADSGVQKTIRLWFEGARLIAWAYVDCGGNLCWELEPARASILGAGLVAWGETCVCDTLANGASCVLGAGCADDDSARLAFIATHGFRETGSVSLTLRRDLQGAITLPEPLLPAGYAIRAGESAGFYLERTKLWFEKVCRR